MVKPSEKISLGHIIYEIVKGENGLILGEFMPLDDYRYQEYYKEYNEKFPTEKCINFLKRLFAPNRAKKTIRNDINDKNVFYLRVCLKDVIAFIYNGDHKVQLIYDDDIQTKIPTFYTSLSMAAEDLKPWVDYFLQINTKYIVNHWFVLSKQLNRKEIVVKNKRHRVNKKFVSNIDLIKKIKEQLISAHCGIQGISAEHDRPERGTGNIP